MDDLRESERVLKSRVVAKCNENFNRIKEDYKRLSRVNNYYTNPSLSDVFKSHGKSNISAVLKIISDSLLSLDLDSADKRHQSAEKNPFQPKINILDLIKNRKYKPGKDTLYTCIFTSNHNVCINFKDYEDGFYNLVYDNLDPMTHEIFNAGESYDKNIENYWKNVKNIKKDEITVLKDLKEDKIPRPDHIDEPGDTVKNFILSNLLGKSISRETNSNYFESYYNFNNLKKISKNFDSHKQLRQIYIRPSRKENEKYGLLAKGLNNDLVLKRVNKDVVEYLVVFDDENMEVYPSESYQGHISSEKHLKKSCIRKFFANEITRMNLRNKVLLKLKRHEAAKAFTAKDMKKNSDKINKSISTVTLGCLWSDWNFFGGGIVSEVTNEDISKNPRDFFENLENNNLVLFTKTFIQSLDVSKRNLDSFDNIASLVSEIVNSYQTLVMGNFNKDYVEIMEKCFLDLKAKQAGPELPILTPERMSSSEHIIDDEQFVIEPELNNQRLQILPKFNPTASTPQELTNLKQLLSFISCDFSPEPFAPNVDVTKVNNVSKTVENAYKNVNSPKNNTLKDDPNVYCALKILDILVFILQKYSKSFNTTKDFHTFVSNSKYKVEFDLASTLFGLFYEKSNDTYMIKVVGSKKLMCYIIWLCIYLSPKHTFDFSVLLNFDVKSFSYSQLFNSCVEITSLVPAGRVNKNLYKLKTPLLSGYKKMNLRGLITNKNKRFKPNK